MLEKFVKSFVVKTEYNTMIFSFSQIIVKSLGRYIWENNWIKKSPMIFRRKKLTILFLFSGKPKF